MQYRLVLEERGHKVVTTPDGRQCVDSYKNAIELQDGDNDAINNNNTDNGNCCHPLFDVVILDYRMPVLDGMGAAREILGLCPAQRIIFASAYVAETLRVSTKELHQIVELLQKPFSLDYLVEIVENTEVYQQLATLNVRVRELHNHNMSLSQLVDLLAGVRKLQSMLIAQ